jgi:hypothetical protein
MKSPKKRKAAPPARKKKSAKKKPAPRRKPAPKAKRKKPTRDSYRQRLDETNARQKVASSRARDVADDYPPPGNRERIESCRTDFRKFLETYFANAFPLSWAPDHLRTIAAVERCVLRGGLQAVGLPRGFGKSSILCRGVLWAALFGSRCFVVLVAATERRGQECLATIKSELLYNPLLLEDFRYVCYPIRRLENNGRRATGQLFAGERTAIDWKDNRISFPLMPREALEDEDVDVSGHVISVAALEGALRGQKSTLPSGAELRPDLVFVDDPSTRESSQSATTTAKHVSIMNGDLLAMGGPGVRLAALMACTVITVGDLSDRFLCRIQSPEWNGLRTRTLETMPTRMDLWEKYGELRAEGMRAGDDGARATAFYVEHRDDMDAGCTPAWPARFNKPTEISAIQSAMNSRITLGEAAWLAEMQNSPEPPDRGMGTLSASQIAEKCNGIDRGRVPLWASHLTMMVDVHDALLFWCVCAPGPPSIKAR